MHPALKAELDRRKKRDSFSLQTILFKEQLSFVTDKSAFKTAVCTRRAGKTVSCGVDLLDTCTKSAGVTCLYITLSRSNAKRIIWPELKRLNREFELGAVPNESELSLTFENESVLFCSGASDKTEIEKFRGLALKKVYIDECQSFPSFIKELIDDVLSPALMDYAGSICLIGTPGPVPAGFFHDCSNSVDWSHHAWTFWSNPYIASKSGFTHAEILQRELQRRGVTKDDPSIQREWFGKWVLDSDALVYHYNPEINHFIEPPPANYTYIMGVDFGYEDADAIAILAYSEKSPTTFLVHETIVPKQGITELVSQIEQLRVRYDISKIVADFGGLGKKIAEEITRRWSIPVTAADKNRKNEAIEIMNDAMRTKRFMAKHDSRFATDSMLLEWDIDKSTPEKKTVSDRFHSDILDAALYAFRESPAFSWQPEITKPKYGTPEWVQSEVDEMERKAVEYFEKQAGNEEYL